MEEGKDENAPPTDKKSMVGYLSPFGILSGMRAMLSPSVKPNSVQQDAEPTKSPTARPALKDANIVRGWPQNNLFQGGGAQGEETIPPAIRDKKSTEEVAQKSWTSDRASLASESSFTSALGIDNTSLPDLLLPEAAYRNGVESDTDTSTVYESAGENEGNVSAIEDQYPSFSESFSVDPSAVSSPLYEVSALDATVVLDVDSDCSKASTPLVDDITVVRKVYNDVLDHRPDSVKNSADVSISDLVDHLNCLSLTTPLKQPQKVFQPEGVENGFNQNGHVTLDSDISADLIDSPEAGLSSECAAVDLNKTVDLCDISKSPANTPVTKQVQSHDETVESLIDDISVTEQRLLEAFHCSTDASLNLTETESELSVTELKLLQDINSTYDFPEVPCDVEISNCETEAFSQATDSSSNVSVITVVSEEDITVLSLSDSLPCTVGTGNSEEDNCPHEFSVAVKEETEYQEGEISPAVKTGQEFEQACQNQSDSLPTLTCGIPDSGEIAFSLNELSLKKSEAEEVVVEKSCDITTPIGSEAEKVRVPEYSSDTVSSNDSSLIGSEAEKVVGEKSCGGITSSIEHPSKGLETEKVEVNISCINTTSPSSESPFIGSEAELVKVEKSFGDTVSSLSESPVKGSDTEKIEVEKSSGDYTPISEGVRDENSVSKTQTSSSDSFVTNFEDVPLPVKVPRSFDEILAEQLCAENTNDSEQQCKDVFSSASSENVKSVADESINLSSLDSAACSGGNVQESVLPFESVSHSLCQESYEPDEINVKQAVSPAKNFDEIPIQGRKHRTFEEILAAELALQESAELAVPSFSKQPSKVVSDSLASTPSISEASSNVSPVKIIHNFDSSTAAAQLNKTIDDILASETTTLEAESEPHIETEDLSKDKTPSEKFESLSEKCESLESLMVKCKLQEMDLKDASSENSAISDHFSLQSSQLSQRSEAVGEREFEDLDSSSSPESNKTVIMAYHVTDSNCNPLNPRPKVVSSPVQRRSTDNNSNPCATQPKVATSTPLQRQALDVKSSCNGPKQVQEKDLENDFSDTNGLGDVQGVESEEFISGDLLKDPSAFDFLFSLHGGSSSFRDLRKESLYVKFDPLVGAYTSNTTSGLPPPASTMQPTLPDNSLHNDTSEAPAADSSRSPADGDPQQVNSSQDNVKNTHSAVSVDKLISFSPASSKKNQDSSSDLVSYKTTTPKSTPVKTPAHIVLNETVEEIGSRGSIVTQEDLIKKLQQHQSVLAEQDKAYQERIAELEERVQRAEKDKDHLNKQVLEKARSLGELKLIMKEYEKTISRLVAEKNQEKAAFEDQQETLIKDRDQAQQHLNNMEIAFSDIHTKYERLKTVVEAFKKNEETLNSALNERQADLEKMQNMYEMLKSHAVSKLEKANQDLEAIKQKHHQETAKAKAMIMKLEVKTKSLEESLQQKTKENQALTTICDELINKVGE